ncbi:MAG: ATP-binding protein [Proteiniphilum sp.]|nr:ATP-binding protein [Proteiniphilum sp.]
MVERDLESIIRAKFFQKKAVIISGPRQVGKTVLVKKIISSSSFKSLYLNCDEPDIRRKLESVTSTELKALIGDAEIVAIDEAQRVKNIGITLKLITDNLAHKQLLVTGSSAFELSNSINEPLTGRKFEYKLFPFSFNELSAASDLISEQRLLEKRIIFGSYPDVVNNPGNEREILTNIVSSYLFKDIFEFQDIRKPDIIEKLLQALALQVGSEVSFSELSRLLGIDYSTVQRYIFLLEKSFVIYHLHSYSRNVRNELKKSVKIYFYDNGIRNALIANFTPLDLRADKGSLWENYLLCERIKWNSFKQNYALTYFWRTTQQQEIDYIEERDGFLHCYEFKWSINKNARLSKTFSSAYPNSKLEVINRDNYVMFITSQ